MLGAGLLIRFRGQESNIGLIVMCQIFIAFGGGTLVIGQQMAVMCAAGIDSIPMMLSIVSLSASIGAAIGSAVSAAIYTNIFPDALYDALPDNAKANATSIYLGGYLEQLTYPVGSDIRNAINNAWGVSQRDGAIAACCILVLAIPAIAVGKTSMWTRRRTREQFCSNLW